MSQHEPERWLMVIFTATQLIFRLVAGAAPCTETGPVLVALGVCAPADRPRPGSGHGAAASQTDRAGRAATGAAAAAAKLVITRPTTSVMSVYGCCAERDDIYCRSEVDIGAPRRAPDDSDI